MLLAALTVSVGRLPLIGAWLVGRSAAEFEAPLVWPTAPVGPPVWWLVVLGLVVAAALAWPVLSRLQRAKAPRSSWMWPRWGWAALAWTGSWWVLAWLDVPALALARRHAFVPLWLGFIVSCCAVVEAWGRASLLRRPREAWALFAVSSLFWWFFEYLNRFVGSWDYRGASFDGPWDVVLHGALPFATVLPAVVAAKDVVRAWPRADAAFASWRVVAPRSPRALGWLGVVGGAAGLVCLPVWPTVLFPLVWLAPLLLLTGAQGLLGAPHAFSGLGRGDWRDVLAYALGALLCGVCWEGWNFWSAPKWEYHVPFVSALHVFEMPVLGYGGYVPFGWECAAVVALLVGAAERRPVAEAPAPALSPRVLPGGPSGARGR